MRAIITYDIKSNSLALKNAEVKVGMKALGYFDWFSITDKATSKETAYYLPNTTLWKNDVTPLQAKTDLLAVAKKVGAQVERLFADEFTNNWVAIPGEPYRA